MKKLNIKTRFRRSFSVLLGAVLIFSTAACDETEEVNPIFETQMYDSETQTTTYYGPTKPLGQGVTRTWVSVNKEGAPTAIGVSMSEKALASLPQGDGQQHGGHPHTFETVLAFPRVAELTPFKTMTLNWNPQGHEPEHVYDKPHFDFHFYTISDAERLAITGLAPDELDPAPPAPAYLPADYVMLPGRIPAMGTHFVDVTSPELHGSPFTQTFIYGGYESNVVFYEPMVTLEYILGKPQATIPLKQPAAFKKSGYYPQSYRVEYDTKRKEHKIYLADLKLQDAQ